MKNAICKFALIILGTLLLSCASKSESTKKEPVKIAQFEADLEKGVEGKRLIKYNYNKDWEIIKTEIITKNESGVKVWIRGSKLSASEVLTIFGSSNLHKALAATSYDDLETETIDGIVFLKFYYEDRSIVEEVIMYIFKGDDGLQIHDVILAAG